jgi:hypothetical protein
MKKAIFILLILLFGAGCRPAENRFFVEENQQNLSRLEIGMSKEQVLSIMGKKYAAHIRSGDHNFEVFYYPTGIGGDVRKITDSEKRLTPLVFDEGILVGWGWEFFDTNVDKYKNRFLGKSGLRDG